MKYNAYMKQTSSINPIPHFKTEAEEAEFWATHDFIDYVDTRKRVSLEFPNLQPSTKSVTIRLPESLLQSLKQLARKKDVPYQSLMKIFLSERVQTEYGIK